jgi:uncharacterized protein
MKMSRYTLPLKIDEDEYLLINARTGAFDLVDKDVIGLLQGTALSENNSMVEFLKERGHLTDLGPADELKLIEDMYQEYTTSHHQFYYHMIIPTYNCNLACTYCFLSDLLSKGKEWLTTVLDDSHIDKIFEVITGIDGSNRRRITLYGGEPLLPKNKSLIEKILKRGKEHGYAFTVLTNGVSLYDFLDVFRKYPIYLVQVTIDGPREIHDTRRVRKNGSGTFEDIVRGVDAALKAGINVMLRTNLDKVNLELLPQIMAFYREKGWSENPRIKMHFSPVFQKSCNPYESYMPRREVYESVVSQAMDNPEMAQLSFKDMRGVELFEDVFIKGELGSPRFSYCEANQGRLIYDSFGDIYVCPEHVGTDSIKVGTYYPELMWNETYAAWRERTILTIPECRECRYALFCGGGCSYEALERFGTLYKPVCYDYREIFSMVIPYLYKSLRKSHAQM